MEKFSIGEIVELKSGGPKMTVTDPSWSDSDVQCMWFEKEKRHEGEFPVLALNRVPMEKEK